MSVKSKIMLATVIIKGAATFGIILYTMVNFAKWLVNENEADKTGEIKQ